MSNRLCSLCGNQPLLVFLAACKELPDESCEHTTTERSADEYPQVFQRGATLEESRADGTSGVNAGACVLDAYEVDEDEGEADSQACEVAGSLLLVGSAKNYKYKYACQHELNNESCELASCSRASVSSRKCALESCCYACEGIEDGSADDGTDNLEHHVEDSILAFHTS